MARPLKPLIRSGGFYPSRKWTPLVYAGGYTTANGGEEPAPPPIEKTVIGNPIHILDALAKPVQALSVKLEPIQAGSGDPSPDNVRPISGHTDADVVRTGVNVWDEEWEVGSISNTTGNNTAGSQIRSKNFIPIKPNTTYFGLALGQSSRLNFQTRFYDADKNYIGTGSLWYYNKSYTTPNNAYYMRFCMQNNYGTTYNNDISINYPSTDTTYHTYQGTTYPIPLGQTVYGGTLDVTTGKLTVTMASVDLGTRSWVKRSASGAHWRFDSLAPNPAPKIPAVSEVANFICSVYKAVTANSTWLYSASGIACNANGNILIADENYADETALTAALTGQTLVYELATPITIQLTPTQVELLQGENNIWSDGTITMTYLADGNASDIEALNILLGGRYVNNHGEDEPADREALDIVLGGKK